MFINVSAFHTIKENVKFAQFLLNLGLKDQHLMPTLSKSWVPTPSQNNNNSCLLSSRELATAETLSSNVFPTFGCVLNSEGGAACTTKLRGLQNQNVLLWVIHLTFSTLKLFKFLGNNFAIILYKKSSLLSFDGGFVILSKTIHC